MLERLTDFRQKKQHIFFVGTKVWHTGEEQVKTLATRSMCARAPVQSCQIKVFVAPQRCFGAYLGCGYRRDSVDLALMWTANRLDDELGLKGEAETGPRVCRSSLRPGLGRAVQSRSPTNSAQRSPRFLMAALLLLTVGQFPSFLSRR